MTARIDLIGKRFGNLLVTSIGKQIKLASSTKRRWWCHCDCGKEVEVLAGSLLNDRTKSCGCLRVTTSRLTLTTHGLSKTPTYKIWKYMIKRCRNKACKAYVDYGGRGIAVCARWMEFENFLTDMGERPSIDHSMERRDNSGNYELSNCEWASRATQSRNRRMSSINKSGVTGVSKRKYGRQWEARITYNGKRIYLGVHATIDEARDARLQAIKKYGFNPNHGMSR